MNDELEILSSIYGDELKISSESSRCTLSIQISELEAAPLQFEFWFNEGYPETAPPSCSLTAPWLPRKAVSEIKRALVEQWRDKKSAIIYDWVEWLRENAMQYSDGSSNSASTENSAAFSASEQQLVACPFILSGEPLVDRKSKFIAHIARVMTVEEIDAVVARIQYEHATAAHPCIFAYRLSDPPREARDDDFEDGAADRLLFLLTKLQLSDVIVCVSRYFGGILLGPDRFKHIMGRAKILLEQYQQNPSILPRGDSEPIESKSSSKVDLKAQRGSAFLEQWESKKQ